MNKLKPFIIVIFLVLSSCQGWLDNQLDALECWPDEIGTVECQDRSFYICPLSGRWEKVISCDKIDDIIIERYGVEFIYYFDMVDLDTVEFDYYLIDIGKYIRCCK